VAPCAVVGLQIVLANSNAWSLLQVRFNLQDRGEPFGAWRAPRCRMPKRPAPKPKRPRSPARRRGEDSSERGGEETPTDEDVVERRTKMRHDPVYGNRVAREKPGARMPHKRRGRVVTISSEEEDEEEHLSAQGERNSTSNRTSGTRLHSTFLGHHVAVDVN
jgi:hypothetical protein